MLVLVGMICAGLIVAEEKKEFTADRHKKQNISCNACHGQEQPKSAASAKACLTCHKSMEAMGERTKDFDKNPHKNHLTEASDLECTQCHQGHKADTILCDQCHTGFKYNKK